MKEEIFCDIKLGKEQFVSLMILVFVLKTKPNTIRYVEKIKLKSVVTNKKIKHHRISVECIKLQKVL